MWGFDDERKSSQDKTSHGGNTRLHSFGRKLNAVMSQTPEVFFYFLIFKKKFYFILFF